MSEMGQEWVGRTVDGRFPLQSYLGGSDRTAVFLTVGQGSSGSEKAAIKLIACDHERAEKQLLRWQAARELNHPNLIRIFEAGRCELDGEELLYVVEEYAEENLSQVLPERALTPEETRGMLPAVLRALQYLHDQGFLHGHIHPSNILAIEDQVKLSSDALGVPGEWNCGAAARAYDPPEAAAGTVSTPGDVWQLGMTLVEVLTQHLPVIDAQQKKQPVLPDGIPEPFREIIENCLCIDPAKRCTATEIADRLEGRESKAASPRPVAFSTNTPPAMAASLPSAARGKRFAKWLYAMALLVAVSVVVFVIAREKPSGPALKVQSSEAQSPQSQQSAAAESPHSAQAPTKPKPSPAAAADTKVEGVAPAARDEVESATADESGILHRVLPQVLPSARSTIQGKIKVRVKVTVEATGKVTQAKFESAGPSKYFARVALEAARGWKFSPAQAGEGSTREWKLQFAFGRTKTDVSAVRAKRSEGSL